jgi:hypothetical protein
MPSFQCHLSRPVFGQVNDGDVEWCDDFSEGGCKDGDGFGYDDFWVRKYCEKKKSPRWGVNGLETLGAVMTLRGRL